MKLQLIPHTAQVEVKTPYAISDKLYDKFILALKGTYIQDVTPYLNFIYGNKSGALYLRVEIDQRFGTTVEVAFDILTDIFKTLRD